MLAQRSKPTQVMVKEQGKADDESSILDSCGTDYIAGYADSFNCTAGSNLTLERSLCRAAIAAANGDEAANWEVDPTASNIIDHPEGCFKGADSKYYFNPVALQRTNATTGQPIPVEGTPMCHRPKYKTGVAHPNGTITCDDGYSLINDEDECDLEGNCNANVAVPGYPFRITQNNASDEANYPKGCFINKPDSKLYFNKVTDDGVVWNFKDQNHTGTPVCKVTAASTLF